MENEEEVWKDVIGYEGLYMVSNKGNVKSLDRTSETSNGKVLKLKGKILKECYDKFGYTIFGICKNGISINKRGHFLVANSFLNHTANKFNTVIDHIDGNPKNNNLNNLQLLTSRENTIKGHKNKTSKYTGVCYHKTAKKYMASIQINKKNIHLGYFKTEEEARDKYLQKLNEKNNATL